mgnify:FL=1
MPYIQPKRKLLRNAKLYLVLDREVSPYERLFEILRQSVPAGVDIVQLRDKGGCAKDILKFSKEAMRFLRGRVPYIINDRVDLALIAKADGVHLGQEDISIGAARKILGPQVIIGSSCQALTHARKAQREGADYIGFGSVFKTLTKPGRKPLNLQLLKHVMREIKIPIFAIGGINMKNLPRLQFLGINKAAVCRDICLARNVHQATQRLKSMLGSENDNFLTA